MRAISAIYQFQELLLATIYQIAKARLACRESPCPLSHIGGPEISTGRGFGPVSVAYSNGAGAKFSERRNYNSEAIDYSDLRLQPIGNSAGDLSRRFVRDRED